MTQHLIHKTAQRTSKTGDCDDLAAASQNSIGKPGFVLFHFLYLHIVELGHGDKVLSTLRF